MTIPRDSLHRYIHEWINDIPAPKEVNAAEAIKHIKLLESHHAISDFDSIEKRLQILIALFDCVEQPTADALRKQLEVVRAFYGRPP